MTKPINEYTVDELSAKIQAIKTERERTANALKRYEEELERKKQEAPLGVPLEDDSYSLCCGSYRFGFASEESRFMFSTRLNDYVKALQEQAKGEPIDIQVLLPLLKKGYVAMDEDGTWIWYETKPCKRLEDWGVHCSIIVELYNYNIKPAENWETSLMECGL